MSLYSAGAFPSVPKRVHFALDFFPHTLKWSPGESSSQDIKYEVQYKRYGNASWQTVPHCSPTSNLSCDLTVETLPRTLGYYGRVRSILGNETSDWVHTTRFNHRDVILPPPSLTLHMDQGSLIVQLALPQIRAKNIILRYEDVFPYSRVYYVHVRRTADNHTFMQMQSSLTFQITDLDGDMEYCVFVQPAVASRGNIGIPSAETCVHLPEKEISRKGLLVIASSIIVIVVLLILINFFICFYIREGVRTPAALKSFIKRSWSWTDKSETQVPDAEGVLHWEREVIAQLLLEPRHSLMRSSGDSGFGSQILNERETHTTSCFSNDFKGDSGISIPDEDSDFKETSQEEASFVKQHHPHIQKYNGISIPNGDTGCKKTSTEEALFVKIHHLHIKEDSGISLSTGSPFLKRNCNLGVIPYGVDLKDTEDCIENGIVTCSQWGYLKQPKSERQSSTGREDSNSLEQVKDYISQGSDRRCKGEMVSQGISEDLQGPWVQIPECFQSSVPLTAAFSPFSSVLWDLRVSSPALGSVELIDSRS
ncbi:interleukin-10 receptor subunit alpha [Bombina bombina]|uniref:interleukin-10 receptor subunit alpha n=1 Tax=Bombina bombina TaxID=8345 RepID=UPI00235B2A9F|nr:interleukin-10 receptor subunit alpha [Bombina bombina]